MKQSYVLKCFFVLALAGLSGVAIGQIHPRAFGPHSLAGTTSLSNSNWYSDYVGARVIVTNPVSIAGPVVCKAAAIGTGSTDWPDIVWHPLVDIPVLMDGTADSFASTAFPAHMFDGKIALIWRGPLSSPVSFTQKAIYAQQAGALAVVIINEYPGQGPIQPSYTSGVGTDTIPVILIGNTDGVAISGVYHTSAPNTVRMTITRWGTGNANDLGFIPDGAALWQYFAVPASQLVAGNASFPYQALDGAFVGNFGTNTVTGTKVKSTLSFTPTGAGTTVEHVDSLVYAGPFTGAGTTDTTADSIIAMFPTTNSEYSLGATSPGRYDLQYTLSSDVTDDYPADNTMSSSFYVTDSLFSRGRYDFANHKPLSNMYEAYASAAEITWGTFYYIAAGGSYISQVQYSVSNGRSAHPSDLLGSNDIYVFKWVDGSNGQTMDSLVQDGELDLVSWTHHPFVTGVDTSNAVITQTTFYDSADANTTNVALDANNWYYIAIDLPPAASLTDTLFLGIDGVSNPYPRIFGRWWDNNFRYLDYSNFVGTNGDGFLTNPAQAEAPLPFTQVSFVNVVDSFSWTNVKGMIPSIALQTTTHPTIDHTGVNNQVKSAVEVSLFPNPAGDDMNVSLSLNNMSHKVTYKIIDGLGRVVSTVDHENVVNDNFAINTGAMRAGTYFLLITADENHTSRKFTVIK